MADSGLAARFAEELNRRTNYAARGAAFYSILMVTPVAVAALLIFQGQVSYTVISTTIQNLLSPGSWFCLSIILGILVAWTNIQGKCIRTTPFVKRSLVACVGACFTPTNLTAIAAHSGFSLLLSYCWLWLTGLSAFSVRIKCYASEIDGEVCWNQQLIFILLGSAFSGFYFWCYLNFENGNYLKIPVIYINKAAQVKLNLYPELVASFKRTLHILKYFYIIFTLASLILSGKFSGLISSGSFLISPTMALTLFLLSYLNQVCGLLISCYLIVSQTQPIHDEDLTQLFQGLEGKGNDLSLLHLLTLQRLSVLLPGRADLRYQLFQLSIPGGHPRNWNNVYTPTIGHLEKINKAISDLISPPPPKEETKPKEQTNGKKWDPFSNGGIKETARRLAPTNGTVQVSNLTPPPPSPAQRLRKLVNGAWESLQKRPAVAWLVVQPPDYQYRKIFAGGQAAIYSVEVLSHLVRASIREDQFGVVQRNLSDILTTLLQLDNNIDRCKVIARVKRDHDCHIRLELKTAIRSALYRIVQGFGEHTLAVDLKPEYKSKLRDFQKFQAA